MVGLDRLLFRAINGWSEALNPVLTDFSVAHDWAYFRLSMVAVVLALVVLGKGRAALLCLLAFPLADALCNAAKHVLPAMRPFQCLPHVTMRVGFSGSMGTASSHAGNLAAVATVMTLAAGWRWGLAWVVIALLVGVSRVYVGAHFPSQVLLGWTLGVVSGFVVERGSRWIGTKWAARRQPSVTVAGP